MISTNSNFKKLMKWSAVFYGLFVFYGSIVPLDFHAHSLDFALDAFANIPFLDLGIDSRADWIRPTFCSTSRSPIFGKRVSLNITTITCDYQKPSWCLSRQVASQSASNLPKFFPTAYSFTQRYLRGDLRQRRWFSGLVRLERSRGKLV